MCRQSELILDRGRQVSVQGKNSGPAEMIACSDMNEVTLEELLRFIYTGAAEAPENMKNLLATVDKHFRRR